MDSDDDQGPYPMVISPTDFRTKTPSTSRCPRGDLRLEDSSWGNYPMSQNHKDTPENFSAFPQNSQFGQQFLIIQCPVEPQRGLVQVFTLPLNGPILLIPQNTPILCPQFCPEIIDEGIAGSSSTLPMLPAPTPQCSQNLVSPEIPQEAAALPVPGQLEFTPLFKEEGSLRPQNSIAQQNEETKPSRRDLYSPIDWIDQRMSSNLDTVDLFTLCSAPDFGTSFVEPIPRYSEKNFNQQKSSTLVEKRALEQVLQRSIKIEVEEAIRIGDRPEEPFQPVEVKVKQEYQQSPPKSKKPKRIPYCKKCRAHGKANLVSKCRKKRQDKTISCEYWDCQCPKCWSVEVRRIKMRRLYRQKTKDSDYSPSMRK